MTQLAELAARVLDDPEGWPQDPKEAIALQRRMADRVHEEPLDVDGVRLVAGLDVSYAKDDPALAAAAVVMDARTLEVVERVTVTAEVTFPYISGLFSFRELPPVLSALTELTTTPDVLVCDGFGLAHPRRFGVASHLGVLLDHPVVGSAKSVLHGRHSVPGDERGSWTPMVSGRSEVVEDSARLADEGAEVIGRVLRTRERVKPVYVSVGHRVDLAGAADLVLRLSPKYRVPEPIRRADRLCGERRKEYEQERARDRSAE
ncbi:endonuclease V [Nocardiopsis kunsanensis]|uniref:Endonuclease V n=1 Tax=Nocardiopsis kunsanensis TaxID=141693 RepID=A0A918XB45_9ACTN|nr:endonuclease V [Nocardiopsis kunsanensis]GHD22778.1 endonuclease V [Nocardiopsis kunsanensis]